jgi:hypothetical protein
MKKTITGKQARNNARWLDIATLVAVFVPVPLLIFLFGGAILIYSLTRFHPNPKVGKYIQSSTYRFYGIMGVAIPIGTFIPLNINYWILFWIVGGGCLILSAFISLVKIQRDDWQDVVYESESD